VIQLFDIIGKMVSSYQIIGDRNRFEFDIGNLCCGIFEYRIFEGDVILGQGKLVIIK
jgi:hypothetical protein